MADTGNRLTECQNCGELLDGPYCAQCGQKNVRARLDERDALQAVAENLFSFDSAIWRTLKGLTLRPGRTVLEYVEGHRRRYVNPLKYLLVATAINFLLVSSRLDAPGALPPIPMPSFGIGPLDPHELQALLESLRTGAARHWDILQLLLLPLTTIILRLAFLGSGHNFAETLCFAAFVTGHTMLLVGLPMYPFMGARGALLGIVSFAGIVGTHGYMAWAAKVFFRRSWAQAILRYLIAAVAIACLQLALFVLLFVAVALLT